MIFATDVDPYVALMASLPAIGLLSEKEPPINRARLAERIGQLAPEDAAEIDVLRRLLSWEHLDVGDDDAAYLDRAERTIARMRTPELRDAARDRLEIRTLVAALRRRHAGEDAPPPEARWGYGRHVAQIRANWGLPDFGLSRSFPWLPAAKDKLESGDAAGLERLLLETAWAAIARREVGHTFDFVAVALYLMRWSLAERWSRYDADAATTRFAAMLEAALADSPDTQETA